MDNNDHKSTWEGFTKFVLWGTIAVVAILVILAFFIIIKDNMIIGSTKEGFIIRKKSFFNARYSKKYNWLRFKNLY